MVINVTYFNKIICPPTFCHKNRIVLKAFFSWSYICKTFLSVDSTHLCPFIFNNIFIENKMDILLQTYWKIKRNSLDFRRSFANNNKSNTIYFRLQAWLGFLAGNGFRLIELKKNKPLARLPLLCFIFCSAISNLKRNLIFVSWTTKGKTFRRISCSKNKLFLQTAKFPVISPKLNLFYFCKG